MKQVFEVGDFTFDGPEVTTTPGTSKVLTKAALAKKALRKNLRTNQVIQFDEEGHGVDIDVSIKKSKEGQEYDDDKAGGKVGKELQLWTQGVTGEGRTFKSLIVA